ncbi:15196_t:CDS:2, partial [Funneliformis geosporum]
MKRYNWTSETPSSELAKYIEEINKNQHGITSSKLRKIGTDHASRIYGSRNDSHHQYLRKLACRQIVSHYESVESYSVMNDPPSCNCSKEYQSSVPKQSVNRHEEVENFKNSIGFSNRVLELIAGLYPNLKYLNLCDDQSGDYISFCVREVEYLGLWKIAQSCHKLEYLNISHRTEFTEISICNIIHSCPDLQHLNLTFCEITNITIEEIARSYIHIKNFNDLKNPSLITAFSDYLRHADTAHQNLAWSLLANALNSNGVEIGQQARIFHQNLAQALHQIQVSSKRIILINASLEQRMPTLSIK